MKIRYFKNLAMFGLGLGAALLMNIPANAQCAAPASASVAITNVTCAGSGAITVNTLADAGGNALSLADCRFSLYNASNTTIVKPDQSSPVLNSLDSGTYVLHIHQVCLPSGISADYTQTVQLTGFYTAPVLNMPTVTGASCNNGSISISATKGYGIYSYCMVNSLNDPPSPGSYVRVPQASGVFNNLAAGTYYVRVYDGCNGFVTMPVIVPSLPVNLSFTGNDIFINDCSGYQVWQYLNQAVTLDANNKAWLTYPDGSRDTLPATSATTTLIFSVPFAKLTTFPATVTLTYKDACGNIFSTPYTFNQPSYYVPNPVATNYSCAAGVFYIKDASIQDHNNGITTSSSPWNFYSLDGGITWKPLSANSNDTIMVATGGSRQVMYKMCGQVYTTTVMGPTMQALNMRLVQQSAVACNGKSGIIVWGTSNGLLEKVLVHVTAQPAAQAPIPDFYLSNTFGGTTPGAYPYQLMNLAPGTYSFLFTDQCGATQSLSITLTASTQTLTVTPQITCGSAQVGINIKYTTNKNGDLQLWYEIRNSSNHLVDSAYTYASGARNPGMTVLINNLVPDIYTVKVWKMDNNQSFSSDTACGKQVFTVDARLPGPLALSKSTFAICTNDPATGSVIVSPQGGLAPYTYTLYKGSVSPAGQVGAPQSSNIFNNLDANAIYIITATDQCGAGSSYTTVFGNVQPAIGTSTPLVPCLGDSIVLSVTKNTSLSYQWTKNGVNIVGATDTAYKIKPMTMADSGAYNVKISANNCLLYSKTAQLDPDNCLVPIPLSIDLISFSGMINAEGNAVLNWKIAKAEPGARFDVLYATDGKNFSKAGSVYEDGLSTKFEFTHSEKIGEKAYYKLLMTENDGKQKYSNVIVLQGGKIAGNSMYVSPLPFTSYININYTAVNGGLATCSIMDVNGRSLIAKQIDLNAGVNTIHLSGLEMLPNGIYLLHVVNAQGERQALKIQK